MAPALRTWPSALAMTLLSVAPFVAHAQSESAAPATPYTWRSVTIKANGFINGIVYSPVKKDAVFMHTDMGGAYRWDAALAQWVCLTDWAKWTDAAAKHMGVETMAVDPTDGGRVYMAVGTYMSPTAIMRSTDGGHTWARTDVPFTSNGNGSARNSGQRMTVDPNAPNVLYYGTRVHGLWKSTDHAETWSRVESFPTIGHNEDWGRNTGIIWTRVDGSSGTPGQPSPVVYVGVFEIEQGVPRIYRSTDAGETWAPMPGEQPTRPNLFPQRVALTPDGSTMYASYSSSEGIYPGPYGVGAGRVYRVTDPQSGSPVWTDVTPQEIRAGISAVTLDPTDPKTVYIGELGNYNPADRIFRSRDGGDSWAAMNPHSHRDDSSATYVDKFTLHWLGDVQIDPHDRDVAMLTTGYGLYRTTNLTADEPTWTFFNEGFEQSACTELVSPGDGPVHLISAIGDRDGYRHDNFDQSPVLGGHGKNQGLSRGTSNDIDVAAKDSRYLVRVVNQRPFVQVSSDNAVTWSWIGDAPEGIDRSGNLAMSANGTRIVWSPERGGAVHVAQREGSSWSSWRPVRFEGGQLRGVEVVADLEDDRTFYAYGGSSMYVSRDGGEDWLRVTDAAPEGFRWVRAVPGHTGHLWGVGFDGVALRRSIDGGATWNRVSPEVVSAAYTLAIGAPMRTGGYPAIFIGGAVHGAGGIFRSDDEGKSWVEVSDEDHHYGQLTVIQADRRLPGRVYLGTNGRGIVYGEPRE